MDTTIDSLKALYVKLEGDPAVVENVTTIPDMINALTEIIQTIPTVLTGSVISTKDEILVIK